MSDPITDVNRLVEAAEVMEDTGRISAALRQIAIIIDRETKDLAKLNKLEGNLKETYRKMKVT